MATGAELVAEARLYSPHFNTRLASDNELLRQLDYSLFELTQRHPVWFATQTSVSPPGAGMPWNLNADGGRVLWIEKDDGTQVDLVPPSRRWSGVRNSVYSIGRDYYAVRTEGGTPTPNPAADTLKFTHGRAPSSVEDGAATPTDFPDKYLKLIVLEMAIYMAMKDQRMDFGLALRGQYDRLLATFDGVGAGWPPGHDGP